ncbi:MAG: M56 family metallopeptidase [Planctomycetota bacterium]
MSGFLGWIVRHGGTLALGLTAVLGVACLAVWLCRAPAHRQRAAELGVLASVAWLVLALLPLPRWLDTSWSERVAPATSPPSRVAAIRPPGRVPAARPHAIEPAAVRAPTSSSALELSPALAAAGAGPATPTVDAGPPAVGRGSGDWSRWAATALVFGSVVALAYLALGLVALVSVVRRTSESPLWLRNLAASLGAQARVPGVRVRLAAPSTRPFCMGWWSRRPLVVLPVTLAPSGEPAHSDPVQQVLRHELAHLARRDGRGHALFAATLPLLWWHPLWWWLRGQWAFSAELLADAEAAAESSAPRYAEALIGVFEQQDLTAPPRLARALSAFPSHSQFYRRMKMLLEREAPLATRCARGVRRLQAAGALGTVVALAGAIGVAPAQDPGSANQLRREREVLIREIDSLRAQVMALQAEARAMSPSSVSEGVSAAASEAMNPLAAREAEPVRQEALAEDPSLVDVESVSAMRATVDPATQSLNVAAVPIRTVSGSSVLHLVTQLIELTGEVRIQEERVQAVELQVQHSNATREQIEIARIRFDVQRRKLEMVHRLAEAEMTALQHELKQLEASAHHAKSLHDNGFVTEAEVMAAESKVVRMRAQLEILGSAL